MGELAGGAIEVAAASDEAAIVVVPVVAVFLIGCAVLLGALIDHFIPTAQSLPQALKALRH